ncbi:hypothetical protein [Microbacterium azadirachtae]|uniref:ABC-2 family transporter protein n=1 Tax=Microbacterium azadirachtae TaxID=582680 RepID=A0A0F0LKP2_9MICO|nr:hypothetical protein [Microbacterium azadirachtae]KJL33703.1 hypothetical protein RS86_01500 [Microbacterium azadirachtae]
MSRILNVVRLQLVNKMTWVWIPLIILVAASALSIVIFAMIPVDGPKYSGAGQAPLWYFFALGLQALTLTFPFSQALSVTRRDFFLGTLSTAVLGSAALSAVFLLGGWIEDATNGWGANGFLFRVPWMWQAGPLTVWLSYFALGLLLFLLGFTGATIYKRAGTLAITLVGVGAGLVLVGLAFLVTRFGLWRQVGEGFATMGVLGLALWGLVAVALLAGISYLVLRRATP